MEPTLSEAAVADLVERVEAARGEHARHYPGGPGGRQPVHTVYVPADRFTATTAADWGERTRLLLDAHAPDGFTLAEAMGLPDRASAAVLRERVSDKLAHEPATVKAMLGQLGRAVDCGAVSEEEVLDRTGLASLEPWA